MNNGYQKSNGCGAGKEGGKIFNTFFYPELQSKHDARLPITLKYTNKHQTTMHLISVNYTLIWQLDFMPNIQFTVCGKCFNVLTKKENS